mmetsp:Transcript_85600/g.250626  ORF Transcript_85600/g.250626 Transcript_85600/m.250626 type:complete len:205 (+) Transcript_85600:218-832(+)
MLGGRVRHALIAEVEAGMRRVARHHLGPDGLELEGRAEAGLVGVEHDGLVVRVAVGVQGVEVLAEGVHPHPHQGLLLRQLLVVPRGSNVVVARDLAEVGVGPRLGLGVLGRVAVEELCVSDFRHQVQAAVAQLSEQRGRAPDAGHPLAGGIAAARRDHAALRALGRDRVLHPPGVFRPPSVCCEGVHHAPQLWQIWALQAQAVL